VDAATGEVKRRPDGSPVIKTSHTLNPVPWLLAGAAAHRFEAVPGIERPGLGNLAATLLLLLGFAAPQDYLPALLRPRAESVSD
jgi:2,3-bisphosphoglycerate-independent phosphoglycerate mutase